MKVFIQDDDASLSIPNLETKMIRLSSDNQSILFLAKAKDVNDLAVTIEIEISIEDISTAHKFLES